MASLNIEITNSFTEVLPIDNRITIGRGNENDVVLLDGSISRRHAQVYKDEKNIFLEDLNSANGIWINGKKVVFRALENGDVIQIGNAKMTFSEEPLLEPTRIVDFREKANCNSTEIITANNILFQFFSSNKDIRQVCEIVEQKLETINATEQEKYQLGMAVNEAIGNAQRHGHKYNEEMVIEFHYLHFPGEEIVFIVRDQGKGFNSKNEVAHKTKLSTVEAAREIYEKGDWGGLGIKVMLKCVDQIEYNRLGNQITLTKYLK
ncbi:FHA domain-containing protein [Candidatus Uabimicrobium amorphum]|uniref:FHA domain-containing protein n=1 Tax=Uabimicrobium amorphum TaxID=2596890 RepID=A0A5S9F5A0_UABAM|nr:FHA domain-containing protein [Candidatus Uabimicrobium amorphum]BBM86616.1 hypothetical protein UABAM_05002 [Candidatus Uabimicrobium amorphum]